MKPVSSEYVDQSRRDYSIYVLEERHVPHATDGLKASGRRVLWKARDGKKIKTAALAGLTMSIHPHDAPDSAINTLTAPHGNNVTLFKGEGAFGTILKPKAYGAPRYTTVSVSAFTKDVVFKDIEIIPMVPNYDQSEQEPKHFLPLVPVALLNPSLGLAVGFRSTILPRSPEDVILAQICVLKGANHFNDPLPKFLPTNNASYKHNDKYVFIGDYDQLNSSELHITKLPYGIVHADTINRLDDLYENGTIVDYIDSSKKTVSIVVKFKRGYLNDIPKDEILKQLGLINSETEHLTLIDFNGSSVLIPTPSEYIRAFTEWRFTWYTTRYERLKMLIEQDIQRAKDIILAIDKNVSGSAKKVQSRDELIEFLEVIGIVNTDYIADLPVYRFTLDEKAKTELKLKNLQTTLAEYVDLLTDESKRKTVYIQELSEILQNFSKGKYS